MKNNRCFDCLNHGEMIAAENNGWYNECKLNVENNGMENIEECEHYFPCNGFQIGGYYSHVHFEFESEECNDCMEMILHSDGEFPTDDPSKMLRLHLCDFRQLEKFVKFWGKYFRKKGIVKD